MARVCVCLLKQSVFDWYSDIWKLCSEPLQSEENTPEFSVPSWSIFTGLWVLEVTADAQHESFSYTRSQGFIPLSSASRTLFISCSIWISPRDTVKASESCVLWLSWIMHCLWLLETDSNLNSSRSPPGTGPERRKASPSMRSCSRYWRYKFKYLGL